MTALPAAEFESEVSTTTAGTPGAASRQKPTGAHHAAHAALEADCPAGRIGIIIGGALSGAS